MCTLMRIDFEQFQRAAYTLFTCGTGVHFEHVCVDIRDLKSVRIDEAEILFTQTVHGSLDGFAVLADSERRVRQEQSERDAFH